MKEYIPALILALVFTLVYSCSDHRKQKKMDKEIEETYSRIKNVHENLLIVNDAMEAAIEDIRREQEVFSGNRNARYDSLWNAYMIERNERKVLADSVRALLAKVEALRSNVDSQPVEADIKRLNAQTTAYIKKNEKLLQSHSRFERMHDELLHGHLTDVH